MKALYVLLMLGVLCSCTGAPQATFFTAENYPDRLSAWGMVTVQDNNLHLAQNSFVYDLNTPLFTDYALKLRTIYIPMGESATFEDFEAFDFPVGSIISKTFFYKTDAQNAIALDARWDGDPTKLDLNNTRLIETRLLVKQETGWDALPYVWRGDDAYLAVTGDLMAMPVKNAADLNYLVPSKNQCAGCHATNHTSGDVLPIGIKARHLNRKHPIHDTNQLIAWQDRRQLQKLPELQTLTPNAHWDDGQASLTHRARSYLDINCGHCHNDKGAADTSGLLLDYLEHDPAALGVCKAPIAAGRGSGGHLYSIVPGQPDTSILTFRMGTNDPGSMMPELGRSLVHHAGHQLISQWIQSLQGECL